MTNKYGKNMTEDNPYDEFICSECGLIMRDFEEVIIEEEGDESYYGFEFKFCPRCGVKIVEEEE